MTVFISLFLAVLASVVIGILSARSNIWSHGPLDPRFVRRTDDLRPADPTPLGWQPFDPAELDGRARSRTYAH